MDRQLSEKADNFPAGYETVKDSFLRLQTKLARQPFTAQFINWRLEKEFRSGYYEKYDPADLAEACEKTGVRPSTGIYLHITHHPEGRGVKSRQNASGPLQNQTPPREARQQPAVI